MRSAASAIAWEFWSANRRGWLIVLAAIPACALLYRIVGRQLHDSDGLHFLCFLPMVMSLILAAAFCNFTDRNRRDGIAGFPRHLFTLPLRTHFLVTCAMVYAVLSVVGVYIVWARFVLLPLDASLLVRWPATLIAAGIVFYQAIIWCLSGFRLTRIVILSLVATTLVGIGFLPILLPQTNVWASEAVLSAALGATAAVAYGAALVTVGAQRRGGARGWPWVQTVVDRAVATLPARRSELKSPDAALFWIEWRRTGFVLPVSVVLGMALILASVICFTDGGFRETMWAETWLVLLPILLAIPIGMGFGKPDFWSLDLSLSPFIAARPVSGGQLLAAKMKAAAATTLVAWTALLLLAPLCIYRYLDTEHWHDIWQVLGILYSPSSQWALLILALVMAIVMTWSLLVGNIWLGYSGRPGFYYSFVGVGMAGFFALLYFLVWWAEQPRDRDVLMANVLPWLPWLLAAVVNAKVWAAAWCANRLQRRGLISSRQIAAYVCIWLVATSCLVLRAWLVAPGIEWLRNTLIIATLCLIPAARLAATPLAIAWNRHR